MATTIIMPMKNRTGTFSTPVWGPIPASLSGDYVLTATMLLSDMQDVGKRMDFQVYISDDNISFRPYAGFTWEGGNYVDKNGTILPGPGLGIADIANSSIIGKYLKIEITINAPMQIGAQIEHS